MTAQARPITPAQLRMVHVLFRGVDRVDRLQRCSHIASRRVLTASDLSADEASQIINTLAREQEQPAW